jgi:hypothetical protein
MGKPAGNRKVPEVHIAAASNSSHKNVPRSECRSSCDQISGKLTLDLTELTEHFIAYLDEFAQFRYLEVSNIAYGQDLVKLDRAVWELRRFCALDPELRKPTLSHGNPAPKVTIPGGLLESISGSSDHPARGPLLWQNAFFGRRVRRRVSPAHG